MREVHAGIWHWEARHPAWTPDEDWGETVSSYAIDDGEHLLLFDPLGCPTRSRSLRLAASAGSC